MEPMSLVDGNFGEQPYEPNLPCPPYQKVNTMVTTMANRPPSTILLSGPGSIANRPRPTSTYSTWRNRLHTTNFPLLTSLDNCFLPISGLVFLLIFSIVINIFLMTWTTFTLDLHKDGLPFKFKPEAEYQLSTGGNLTIKGKLLSESIEATVANADQPNTPLTIAPANVDYLQLKHAPSDSSITFSDGNIELRTGQLSIQSDSGASMRVTPEQVTVEQSLLRMQQPSGGLRLDRLDTSAITANLFRDMRVESRTERVTVNSKREILLESNNGEVELTAHGAVELKGEVTAKGRSVILPPLAKANHHRNHHHHHHHLRHQQHNHQTEQVPLVYQLCICENGRLFVAEVENTCEANSTTCSDDEE